MFNDPTLQALRVREQQLRSEAGAIQKRLDAAGVDWQEAWKTHPVAIAYRQLLKEAWEGRKP